MTKYLTIFIILLTCNVEITAQAWNPFDIKNRDVEEVKNAYNSSLDSQDQKIIDSTNPYSVISTERDSENLIIETFPRGELKVNYKDSLDLLGNPFEIVRVPIDQGVWETETEPGQDGQSSFIFVVLLVILIGLSILVSLFRSVIPHMIKSMFNANFLKLMQRTRNETIILRLRVFYLFFFINGGVFLFLILQYYDESIIDSEPRWLLFCTLILIGFFLLKHLLLHFIANYFPPKKEALLLSFMFLVSNSFLGLILVPINILLAFGGEEMAGFIVLVGLIVWIGLYIAKQVRAIILSASVWVNNVFHFFLYLCAVEIAPVCILWKLSQTVG